MPAPDTGGTKSSAGSRAVVETLSLDAAALADGELNALTLQHSGEQFTSTDLESLATLQAELERFHHSTVSVDLDGRGEALNRGAVDSVVTITRSHGRGTPETIVPEISDGQAMDVGAMGHSTSEEEIIRLGSTSHSITTISAPSISKGTSGSSIVVIQSPISSSASGSGAASHVTVSGGQILGKIATLGNNITHFQPISRTLVTAKSADGNIVQLQPANMANPSVSASTSNLHGVRPLQASVKRPASSTSAPVFAKVIITGNQHGNSSGQSGSGSQQLVLSTSQAGGSLTAGQPIKIVTSGGGSSSGQSTLVASPTKAITLAQAQQMGLISPSKLQQILPSSPSKQSIVVNKLVSSPVKSPAKITTIMPGTTMVKSPAKILPAPVSGISQLKVATSQSTSSIQSTTNKPIAAPQKVIIRQTNLGGTIKAGPILNTPGSSQVIRIPATQNVMTSGSIAQIQIPGTKQLQYVRLVSAGGTNTTPTVVTAGKPRTTVVSTTGNRPGSQQTTVKMVPIAPAQPPGRSVLPKTGTTVNTQRILIPASGSISQLRAGTVTALPASAVGQLQAGQALLPSGASSYVMVPAHYVQQQSQQQTQQAQQPAQAVPVSAASLAPSTASGSGAIVAASVPSSLSQHTSPSLEVVATTQRIQPPRTTLEPNGIRPRKPCNCTKSQCLKLYCDCFANGEFCNLCNCNNCYNNLEHEEDRQRAIRSCLERNPNAFRPKIGKGIVGDERRHNKGCNCKRSGCLKNYCECYEAKIPCSNNCKCVGCRNVEDTCDKKSLRDLAEAAEVRVQQQAAVKNKVSAQIQDTAFRPQPQALPGIRSPASLMTQEVLEATCECLLAQAEAAETQDLSEEEAERLIIEEFGQCLVQIIQCTNKREKI